MMNILLLIVGGTRCLQGSKEGRTDGRSREFTLSCGGLMYSTVPRCPNYSLPDVMLYCTVSTSYLHITVLMDDVHQLSSMIIPREPSSGTNPDAPIGTILKLCRESVPEVGIISPPSGSLKSKCTFAKAQKIPDAS